MSALVSFVNEVEDAIASEDPIRRVDTLRRLTALFVSQAPHLNEAHVEIFDEVILRLAQDLEFRARLELAERLGCHDKAPRKVVRSLAYDGDIAVAGPVLERSPRLDEEDLVAIASDRGQEHLLALSRRPSLSERLTDVLVDRGDEAVLRTVTGNGGARFSEHGFSQLMDKAREDAGLQGLLRARRDLPPRQLARLVEIAREKVRETLRNEFGEAADDVVDAALDDVASVVTQEGRSRLLMDDFDEACEAVRARVAQGGLSEDDVMEWIREGRVEVALAGIAHLAGMPVEMVARAYRQTHYDPLLFIVRSVRFGWGTFKLLLAHKAGRQPPADMLKSAFEAFQQLSVQTAQRVVRFTAARERAIKPAA